jgi:dephospho-CoA kinase
VNNEVIVVTAPRNIQEQRLRNRGYPDEKIKLRLSAQLTAEKKIGLLRNKIEKDGFGTIIQFENGESNGTAVIAPLYEKIIETMLKHAVK